MTKIVHRCEIPYNEPRHESIHAVITKWRCPECGDRWKVQCQRGGTWGGDRLRSSRWFNIRHYFWVKSLGV